MGTFQLPSSVCNYLSIEPFYEISTIIDTSMVHFQMSYFEDNLASPCTNSFNLACVGEDP
jgi:hypothetical protein